MNRPITTLFMFESLDGKISTGSNDNFDADKDFFKMVIETINKYKQEESLESKIK